MTIISTQPSAAREVNLTGFASATLSFSFHVRTAGPIGDAILDIYREARAIDRGVMVYDAQPMTEYISASLFGQKIGAILLNVLGGLALLMAALGLYGVMTYTVAQRTHEIGIRLALGASGQRVLGEVVARAARLTGVAVFTGLVLAVAAGRFVATVLFGVRPSDPATLAGAAAVLAIVSLAACYLPARRASRVDPVVALAEE